jgi:hypothetical protein
MLSVNNSHSGADCLACLSDIYNPFSELLQLKPMRMISIMQKSKRVVAEMLTYVNFMAPENYCQIIIIIIFISINPVQSRMWKSQYKYKISSTEYEVNIVTEASKYIKQSDII